MDRKLTQRFACAATCRIVGVGSSRAPGSAPCHCLDCRKHHGALVHASAGVPGYSDQSMAETLGYRERLLSPLQLVRFGTKVFRTR